MNAMTVEAIPGYSAGLSGSIARYNLKAAMTDDGTPVNVSVVAAYGIRERPRLVFVAGVHGDEIQGMHGLHALLHRLDPGHVSGTLIAVMCANPLAFQAGRRCAPQDDVDLNRVFPGDLKGSVSCRLAFNLFNKAVAGADFVLTLHSWGSAGVVMPYVEYPAGDSAVAKASFESAAAFGVDMLTPLEWHPGLLPAAANRAGIPAAEVEIGGGATASPGLTRLYSGGMESVLRHWGLLRGAPAGAKHPRKIRRRDVTTPVEGLLRRRSTLGARVKAGGLLGTIVDIHGDTVAEIRSPADGVLGAHRVVSRVSKRDGVFSVFELVQ